MEKSFVKVSLLFPGLPPLPPEAALREGSPAILSHLQHGCPSCSAGLRLLADPERRTVRDRFQSGFAAGLKRSPNPVTALHAALAELSI